MIDAGTAMAAYNPLLAQAPAPRMSEAEARTAMPPPPPLGDHGLVTTMRDFTFSAYGPRPKSHYFRGTLLPTAMSGASGVHLHKNGNVDAALVWPGKIIWAQSHATALDPSAYDKACDAMERQFEFIDNTIVCSKERPMIVLWSYPWALFALPCGTKGKAGLSKISDAKVKSSYFCVRDHRIPEAAFCNDGIHDALVADMREGSGLLSESTVVDVTNPQIVNLKDKIRLDGHLSPMDTKRLYDLWHQYMAGARAYGSLSRRRANIDRASSRA